MQHHQGATALLLAVTLSLARVASAVACVGDCDASGAVAINELIQSVNIALGTAVLDTCANADLSGDGSVTVDELIAAVNSALNGCAQVATPTPTELVATPSATATATPTTGSGNSIPPTNATDLVAWLQAGMYRSWTAESARHPSSGPHGGVVRTFLNDMVLESLQAGNAAHPAGSALVKELYFSSNTVQLWAVSVKLQDNSAGGRGWYWFEGAALAGVGLPSCTGCHALGRDYVRSPFPLQ